MKITFLRFFAVTCYSRNINFFLHLIISWLIQMYMYDVVLGTLINSY